MTARLGILALLCAASAFAAAPAPQDAPIALDIYVFRQKDSNDGQAYRQEGFEYYATRVALADTRENGNVLRASAVVAFIESDPAEAAPATVINANTTSASGDLVTLDALISLQAQRPDHAWTYTPGIFYHHQIDYIGAGFDLGASRMLAGGDAEIALGYGPRYDFLELNTWDERYRGSDERISNNLLASWTQNVTTRTRTQLSAQYTRQNGYLADPYNFVTIYRPSGAPYFYTDERLPEERQRFQFNGRAKWAASNDQIISVDASYYDDDWELSSWSTELGIRQRVGAWSARVWLRYLEQDATKYFVERPRSADIFQTQDSDLGSFSSIAPGLTLTRRSGSEARHATRIQASVWGLDRDDGISAIGGRLGWARSW